MTLGQEEEQRKKPTTTTSMFSFASNRSSPLEEPAQQRKPRYPGEDTTPTRKKEILGWYVYGIAAEVFAVSGVGALICLYCCSQLVLTALLRFV